MIEIPKENLNFTEKQLELIKRLRNDCPDYDYFFVVGDSLGCIAPFIYTRAILLGLDNYGYSKRWCYGTMTDALCEMVDWLTKKSYEPIGYIRKTHKEFEVEKM